MVLQHNVEEVYKEGCEGQDTALFFQMSAPTIGISGREWRKKTLFVLLKVKGSTKERLMLLLESYIPNIELSSLNLSFMIFSV